MNHAAPNILLIHSDQHRWDCLGANGHALVQTPALDRLARQGANFSHAFSTCPLCTPARASLLTGAWPTTHGAFTIPRGEIYRPARAELPTLTQLLKQAGYQTAMVGKVHGEVEGFPERHGVDRFINARSYSDWRNSVGVPPVSDPHGAFGDVDEQCPSHQSSLAWQADNVIALLDRRVDERRPFFMRWDPPEPHLPCQPTRPFADRYRAADIAPWPSWGDSLQQKPEVQARQRRIWGVEGWDWSQWAPIVARYFAIITEMDHHIGRVLAWLDERVAPENLLVIYTTDHGDLCGGHGQMDKHFAMYDDITRVPFVLRWPGTIEPGRTSDAFVSNEIDLAATVLGAAGVAKPATFAGRDAVRLAHGNDPEPRSDIFSQYFGTESGLYSQRMLRDRRFKYIYNPTAFDELYDLDVDPAELRNRIDDPALRGEAKRLRARLAAWMREIRDPLLNHWTEVALIDGPSQAQRYSAGRDHV